MKKKQIILIGGGGHCKSCIEVIESTKMYEIVGIVEAKEKIGEEVLGYTIIATDNQLKDLRKKYQYALITVGQIKSAKLRVKLFNLAKDLGFLLPTIIASTAYVSKHTTVGEGTIVMHQAMINANVKVGENCIINSKALIEHDCEIGNHCHISTKSTLNGNVIVGNQCFIGSNTTFYNDINITSNVILSSNSLISKSIKKSGVYVGSPLRKIR